MGFMNEKFEEEKENVKKGQAIEISAAVTTALVAAIAPLKQEITTLKRDIRQLKEVVERTNTTTATIDEGTRNEIRNMMRSAAEGIESYKYAIYALFGMVLILAAAILCNSYKLNETAANMAWKYDVVTGILSDDRHYWWDGENYEASRKAPETKRLKDALDKYQKITKQQK